MALDPPAEKGFAMASAKDLILKEIVPEEVIDLAKALIRIPSYTTDETPVARFLDEVLRREGLESRLQEVDPGRFQALARLPGIGGGRSLMFNGHIDIDPLPGGWIRDPGPPPSRATASTGPASTT